GIDVVGSGDPQLIEQIKQPPHPDPVPIIAPGIIPLVLGFSGLGRIPAPAFAVGVDLKIGYYTECQSFTIRPAIIPALDQGNEVVPTMLGKHSTDPSGSYDNFISACRPERHAIFDFREKLVHPNAHQGDHDQPCEDEGHIEPG